MPSGVGTATGGANTPGGGMFLDTQQMELDSGRAVRTSFVNLQCLEATKYEMVDLFCRLKAYKTLDYIYNLYLT